MTAPKLDVLLLPRDVGEPTKVAVATCGFVVVKREGKPTSVGVELGLPDGSTELVAPRRIVSISPHKGPPVSAVPGEPA